MRSSRAAVESVTVSCGARGRRDSCVRRPSSAIGHRYLDACLLAFVLSSSIAIVNSSAAIIHINTTCTADDIRNALNGASTGEVIVLLKTFGPNDNYDYSQLHALLDLPSRIISSGPYYIKTNSSIDGAVEKARFICNTTAMSGVSELPPYSLLDGISFEGCSMTIVQSTGLELYGVTVIGGTWLLQNSPAVDIKHIFISNGTNVTLDRCTAPSLSDVSLQNASLTLDTCIRPNLTNMSLKAAYMTFDTCTSTSLSDIDVENGVDSSYAQAAVSFERCTDVVIAKPCHFVDNALPAVQLLNVAGSSLVSGCEFLANNITADVALIHGRGALTVRFDNDATGSNLTVVRSFFRDNTALKGGGVSIDFFGNSAGNSISIESCHFEGNSVCKPSSCESTAGQSEQPMGGGLSVSFNDRATSNNVTLQGTVFRSNKALRGGGVMAIFNDSASGNKLFVEGTISSLPAQNWDNATSTCEFIGNTAGSLSADVKTGSVAGVGGGIGVEVGGAASENIINVRGCVFQQNKAIEGGGFYLGFYRNKEKTDVSLTNSFLTGNCAITGAAVSFWAAEQEFDNSTGRVLRFEDLSFTDNVAYFRGALSITALVYETHGDVYLRRNINSAVHLRSSLSHLYGHMHYYDNVAQVGAGFFTAESQTVAHNGSAATFVNNTALSVGGGMFAYVATR